MGTAALVLAPAALFTFKTHNLRRVAGMGGVVLSNAMVSLHRGEGDTTEGEQHLGDVYVFTYY